MKTLAVSAFAESAAALLCGWALSAGAADVVVTFDPPSLPNGARLVNAYDQSGVYFGSALTNSFVHSDTGLSLYPTDGTAYLTVFRSGAYFNMLGAAFTVKQVDIAEYSTVFATPQTVTFTGRKADGTTVAATFTTDGVMDGPGAAADFQTFAFPASFSGVTNVVVTYGNASPALDNLTLSTGALVALQTLGAPVQCGSPLPFGYGTNAVALSTVVTSSVAETVSAGDGVRYLCAGWTGTGSIPASGSGHSVTAAITNNSTLTWNWKQQYQLVVSASGRGSVSPSVLTNIWGTSGTNFFLTAIPASNATFLGWSGSTNGCAISGRNIRVPMTQARALTALFDGAPTNASHLVLWNRLGSESEMRASAAGPNALAWRGTFVPGVFGNALQLSSVTNFAVTFPVDVVPKPAGCIEFWAKFLNPPSSLPAGERVIPVAVALSNNVYHSTVLHFNGNDGVGNGGLCARLGNIGSTGTGSYGSWTYTSALKGASPADWHHYALVWSVDPLPGLTNPVRRVAVYVDGALNSASWLGADPAPSPLWFPAGGKIGLMYLAPTVPDVRPVVDNVKIWDIPKTDFSDRFSEGSERIWSLKITSAVGQTEPAAGTYVCTNGAFYSVRALSPVLQDDMTRLVCTGAVVTGNAYTQVSPTQVALAVTNNAEVAWQWKTQYRLLTQVEGEGLITPAGSWPEPGSSVTLTATPAPDWTFVGWKGDTGGCEVDGATIRAPMTRARALVAAFASVWPQGAGGLVLWNRLGAEAEVRNSEIGPAGTLGAATFGPGVFGSACEVGVQWQTAATFPFSVVPRYAGCIEFWARATVTSDSLPWGERIHLLSAIETNGIAYPAVDFNGNDGIGDGGLCARLGGIGTAGTGSYGTWTYSGALKGAPVSEWHHYALAWDVDGLKGQTNPVRRMALYVDGVQNSGHWYEEKGAHPIMPNSIAEGGELGLLLLRGAETAGAAIDNIKVWNYGKTDFSDRFRENAGVARFDLTVSGARGATQPADGLHSLASGSTFSACAESPVTEGATRYLCTGATVTGVACEQPSATNVSFAVTNAAALTWNWQTQFRLAVETQGSGSVTPAEAWQDEGAEVALAAEPAAGWFFGGWEGDTAGCLIDGASIRVPMTAGRTIQAVFIERVLTPLETFAAWPENVPLAYRRIAGLWWHSNELGGLFCDSPAAGGFASFQITVSGPGLVTFDWQLSGADGTNELFCSVGSQKRGALKSAEAAQASVAVASGAWTVRWTVRRGPASPETSGLLRNIRWEPLPQASNPQPASGSQLPERDFTGLAWTGDADSFLVYAGKTSSSLTPVGSGAFTGCSVPADSLAERVAAAQGNPIYWRADAVRTDSFGVKAVSAGPVWNVAVLPDGAPEFELAAYADDSLVVGARCALGPFAASPGAGGQFSAKVVSGTLPPGLSLALTDAAVSLAGVPAQAGRYQATIRLSSRTQAQKTVWGSSLLVDLTVAPLADGAGDYEGWADGSTYGEGTAQLSVTPKGRISGKLALHGTNYTLKADAFDGATNGVCFAALAAKQGSRVTIPLELAVSTGGVAQAAFAGEPDAALALIRNSWTARERAEFAEPLAGTYAVTLPDLVKPAVARVASLTVQPNGKTLFSGVTAAQSRFIFTGSLLIVPADGESAERFFVVVYGALPQAGSGRTAGGLFGVLEVVPGDGGANAVEAVIPLRAW